jgi:hypothetical protein
MNEVCAKSARSLGSIRDVPTTAQDGTRMKWTDIGEGAHPDLIEEMLDTILQAGPEGAPVTLSPEDVHNLMFILTRVLHLSRESLHALATQMEEELKSNLS